MLQVQVDEALWHGITTHEAFHSVVQAILGSRAGLRCSLGRLLHAGTTRLAVTLRGSELAALNPLVMETKQLSKEQLAEAVSSVRDVELRHYRVTQRQSSVMCVAVQLAGGPAEVRTADGVVLRLG